MIFNRRYFLTGALATAFVPAAPAIVKAASTRRLIFEFGDGNVMKTKPQASADWTAIFNEAANSGSPVEVPPGAFPMRSFSRTDGCVYVNAATPIDFACAPDARLIAGAELSNKRGAMFTFINPNGPTQGTSTTLRFTGGYFDGSALTSAPADGYGLVMLDIFQYSSPYIASISGNGGSTDPNGARLGAGFTDTLITTHNCYKELIVNVWGIGFYDCMLYISGDDNGDQFDGRGELGIVRGAVATRCGNGIAVKRDYIGLGIENCSIWHCQNGIIGSPAGGLLNDQGKGTRVTGGQIGRIQGRPILIFGTNPIVENVTIGDFGINLADKRTPTDTAVGNEIAAIDLRGVTGGRVVNNIITTRSIASDPRSGIAVRKDAANNVSSGCKIYGNDMSGLPRAIYTEAGSSYDPTA